jgi:oligoribonuclease (3'-5' exoribonuclease)
MQLGCIVVPWDPVTMRVVKHEVPGLKYKAEFPITQGPEHMVTDWVRENQADLLKRCEALESGVYKTSRDGLIKLLKRATDLYGAPIIPCGWCLGSDMAYLHRTLHDDHELVHYSAIDLKGMIMALMGTYDPGDKEAAEFLGVTDKNENEHDALADAEHQLRLILAAFKKINESKNPRESKLRSLYGMTAEDYEATAELQNWACAVCEEQDDRVSEAGVPMPLSVDHDHSTSRVRGLLCHRCNTAIGLLRDDPKIADRVAEYLRLNGRR